MNKYRSQKLYHHKIVFLVVDMYIISISVTTHPAYQHFVNFPLGDLQIQSFILLSILFIAALADAFCGSVWIFISHCNPTTAAKTFLPVIFQHFMTLDSTTDGGVSRCVVVILERSRSRKISCWPEQINGSGRVGLIIRVNNARDWVSSDDKSCQASRENAIHWNFY